MFLATTLHVVGLTKNNMRSKQYKYQDNYR